MNEASWLLGNVLCALGVALCTKANFGLSMVAAPPYIFNQFFVKIFPWFTQGTAEYFFQALLLLVMCLLIRKFSFRYLFSFVTAVIFGKMIDAWLAIFGGQAAYEGIVPRIFAFAAGELITALAIAFFFRTDLPLNTYELFVVKVAEAFDLTTEKAKLIHDIALFTVSVLSTLLLFHGFVGVGIGTVVITLVNAWLIKMWGKLLDKLFDFKPLFPKLTHALRQ